MCVHSYPCNSWSLKCKNTLVDSITIAEIVIVVGYYTLFPIKGTEPQIVELYLLPHVNFSKSEGLQMGVGRSYGRLNVFNEKLLHVHAKEWPCLLKNLQQTSTFRDTHLRQKYRNSTIAQANKFMKKRFAKIGQGQINF